MSLKNMETQSKLSGWMGLPYFKSLAMLLHVYKLEKNRLMIFLFVYRCVYPLTWFKIHYWKIVHTAEAFDEVVHRSFSALPPVGACVLLPIPQDDQHISPSCASFGLLSLVSCMQNGKFVLFIYARFCFNIYTSNVMILIIKIYKCSTNLPLLACFKTDTMVEKFGRNIGISSQHILIKSKILRSAAFEGTFGRKGGDSTVFTRCTISEERVVKVIFSQNFFQKIHIFMFTY